MSLITFIGLLMFTATAYAEPDNTYAYVSNTNSNTISVIDVMTLTKIIDIPTDAGPSNVIVNPAGTYLYVAFDKTPYVCVYSTTDYTLVKKIKVTDSTTFQYTRMAMNDEGTRLYVTISSDQNLYVIDTTTYTVYNHSTMYLGMLGVEYYNGRVYVAQYAGNKVYAIDPVTLNVLKEYAGGGVNWPYDFAVNPTSNKLYVMNSNGTATVIDLTTQAYEGILNTYRSVSENYFSGISVNTSGYIYVADKTNGVIAVFNPSRALVTNITGLSAPYGVAANNYNNTVFVAGNGDGNLYVIDTTTNAIIVEGYIGNGPYQISIGTQATPVQHRVKFVTQSIFGLIKYEGVTVSVYDANNILQQSEQSDDGGAVSFYLSPTTMYRITAISQADGINETINIIPYDETYYFNVWSFFTNWNPFSWAQGVLNRDGPGTGYVERDVVVNYSVDRASSPRQILLNYSDATASTTDINFTLLRHWDNNGSDTVYNTTLISGTGISYQQMPINVPASDADGKSYKIVVTSVTDAYGTVKRFDSYHFPGIAYPIPGLAASDHVYVAFGVIILFGLFFTYISTGLGLITMSFWGIVFMFMGWIAWSDTFMLLLNILAVFGVGYILKQKKQREGI